jgi:hypothetical protein
VEADNPPRCVTCNGLMTFHGRISLPSEIIYRCNLCSTETWVPNKAPMPSTPDPRAQQQQQPQPDDEKKE